MLDIHIQLCDPHPLPLTPPLKEFHYNIDAVCSSSNGCALCLCSGTIVSHSSCFVPKINYWKYFLLLMSLYWTCCVLSNIVHVATAHCIAHWWFYGLPRVGGVVVRVSYPNRRVGRLFKIRFFALAPVSWDPSLSDRCWLPLSAH